MNHKSASYETNKCLLCWKTSTCIILPLTAIKIERAITVTHRAKDPSLQESWFLVEWENVEKALGMAIRVAIVAVLMATKKIC